jgi:molybdopterin/thiamine biosynthesis adenylyltransferase
MATQGIQGITDIEAMGDTGKATLEARVSRYKDIIPVDSLTTTKIMVVGVGAIGRQAALLAASMGVQNIVLIDFDQVEAENMGPQGYRPDQIDMPKVEATKADCLAHNPDAQITALNEKFRARSLIEHQPSVVFCCVDDIRVRRTIWENVKITDALWVDARMSAETCQIYPSAAPHSDYYESTLFEANETYEGSCTAKSTMYCAGIAAGLMLAQFTKHLRGIELDPAVTLNIFGNEFWAVYAGQEDKAQSE